MRGIARQEDAALAISVRHAVSRGPSAAMAQGHGDVAADRRSDPPRHLVVRPCLWIVLLRVVAQVEGPPVGVVHRKEQSLDPVIGDLALAERPVLDGVRQVRVEEHVEVVPRVTAPVPVDVQPAAHGAARAVGRDEELCPYHLLGAIHVHHPGAHHCGILLEAEQFATEADIAAPLLQRPPQDRLHRGLRAGDHAARRGIPASQHASVGDRQLLRRQHGRAPACAAERALLPCRLRGVLDRRLQAQLAEQLHAAHRPAACARQGRGVRLPLDEDERRPVPLKEQRGREPDQPAADHEHRSILYLPRHAAYLYPTVPVPITLSAISRV